MPEGVPSRWGPRPDVISMRIAIVGNFGLTGKQTMAVRALPLARELASRGHSVRMMLPVRRDSDRKGPKESEGVGISYAGRGPRIQGLVQIWQVIRLAWLVRCWKPEVVYCFKPIAHSGALLALFWWLRRLGLCRVLLALDTDDWEGTGGWNERQPFPGWLKRLISWQEQWSLRHADVVTVASKALMEMCGQVGARRIVYLPNAVANLQEVIKVGAVSQPPDLQALKDRPVVLLYTRFFEFGLDRLIRTCLTILQQVPRGVLLVVGEGLNGEEKLLEKMAVARGIADRVILAGWVPPQQLPGYFAAADVALYPMDDTLLNRTKCPMKLLDLMTAGVPVVADRVGQTTEYLVHGVTGVLVDPSDAGGMATAVVELLRDPGRRIAMGKAAQADAISRWSWKLWAAEAEHALASELAAECGSTP